MTNIRNNAKTRGLPLEVTHEYIESLFTGFCALSNVPLSSIDKASLDRIDSSLGYIEGNLQWVHKDVNKMKNDFNQDHFIEFCKLIAKHNQ